MKHWQVTIKVEGIEKPVISKLINDMDEKRIVAFLGLKNDNVEWYRLEEVKRNPVTCFMWWCYNKQMTEELPKIFGEDLGKHLARELALTGFNYLRWYANLDNSNRDKIVDYVTKLYNSDKYL